MAEESDDHASAAVEFHPEAEAEMNAAARYYDDRQSGLGEDFLREIKGGCCRCGVSRSRHARRWGLSLAAHERFPYAVLYWEVRERIARIHA